MSAPDTKDKAKARGKAKNPDEASPVPPEDLDERLVFDAQKLACSYVNSFVSRLFSASIENKRFLKKIFPSQMTGELALVSDVDNKDSQPSEEKVAKNKKQAGKAVISKSRSPSAKDKEKAKSPKGKKGSKTNKVEEAPQQGTLGISRTLFTYSPIFRRTPLKLTPGNILGTRTKKNLHYRTDG
jgi:hypothetical protein